STDPMDPCRDCYPVIEIAGDTGTIEPGWTVVELNLANAGTFRTRPIAFDSSGRVRWMLKLDYVGDWVGPLSESLDGNLLTGWGSHVYELNRLGRVLRDFQIPGYSVHHEV